MAKHSPITRKQVSSTVVRLTVSVSAAQFREGFEAELAQVAKSVKVAGFRAGKVPPARALQAVGRPAVEGGALDRALRIAYMAALTEEALNPVSAPELKLESFTPPSEDDDATKEVAVFSVEIEIVPDFDLKGYQKLRVKPVAAKAIDEGDVHEFLTSLRKQRASLKPATDDAVAAKGMWANIGFSGTLEGIAREELTSDNLPLTLGDGQLIPGFEDEIYGMKTGEDKTFTITFPKDYRATQFAGKEVVFTVTLHEIKEVVLPVLDDAFAKTFGLESVSSLEEQVRDALQKEREREADEQTREIIFTELAKLVKVDLPKSLLDQETERLVEETSKRFGGELPDDLRKQIDEQAPKNVRLGLAVGKLVALEGLTGQEKAAEQAVERLVEMATASAK
jgi:trigger factor